MLLGFFVLLSPSYAMADNDAFSASQKGEIEKIIREFIEKNPEILVDSIREMQARRERESREKAKANLIVYRDQLVNDPTSPVGGNPDGDVTIVEFFDYKCGFCKRVYPTVMKVLEEDAKIRYVFKEFPILGAESVTAARAALAAWRLEPKKYHAFHSGLMETLGALSESRVLRIASQAGFDRAALKRAMKAPEIDRILEQNYRLAEALNINGTPAFVIGDALVPGAIDLATLKQLIDEARRG